MTNILRHTDLPQGDLIRLLVEAYLRRITYAPGRRQEPRRMPWQYYWDGQPWQHHPASEIVACEF